MAKDDKVVVHTVQLEQAERVVVQEALKLLQASRARARSKVVNPAIAEAMDNESRFIAGVVSKF